VISRKVIGIRKFLRLRLSGKNAGLLTSSSKSCVLAGMGGGALVPVCACSCWGCVMMSLGSSSMSSPEKPNAKDIVDLKVTSVPFFLKFQEVWIAVVQRLRKRNFCVRLIDNGVARAQVNVHT
jgi:hypothetical protein